MKVGDLVVSKAYQNYANIVPAKLVLQITENRVGSQKGPYVVTDDRPNEWQQARNFFVVSPA
tara:strand:+ start:334 stop:519 length:186 start_codon:yes stop_codon:yes gene_type:complete